jgi:hypothetical protein
MKISIPENLKGKELFEFLVQNKSVIIAQKKALPKKADPFEYSPSYFNIKNGFATKTSFGEIPEDATSVRVKIAANAAMWMDSQKDILLRDSWAKSIRDGKGNLHLKDHTYELDAEIGDVVNIYSQDISLTELGLSKAGTTQVLVYESDVKKSYDERIFNKYKTGKIKQHSIGLQYVKIELAINDDDYKEELAVWNKYINQIINKQDAEQDGYFWAVSEIKLIEVSAVLLGANELTPTLSVSKDTVIQPLISTEEQPLHMPAFDLDKAIKQIKFFN